MRLLTLLGLVAAVIGLTYVALCLTVSEEVRVEERWGDAPQGQSASDLLQGWVDTHPICREPRHAVWGQTTGEASDTVQVDVFTGAKGSGRLRVWQNNESDTASWMRSAQWRFPFLLRGWKQIEGMDRVLFGQPSDDSTSDDERAR